MNIRFGSRFAALLALAFGLAACGGQSAATPLRAARAESAPEAPTSAPAAPVKAAVPVSGPTLGTLDIHSVDLGFQPNNLKVDQPGRYTIKLTNDGALQHDITFPDGTKLITVHQPIP